MSFNAIFYTFTKKQNSTAQPSGSGTTFSVELKENCSVVNPILRVYNTANFNPSDLNYCYINKFSRYYWVEDWEYGIGEWLAHLRSDPLASFKAGIGNLTKYILRCSYLENLDIVDDLYPLLADRPSNYVDSHSFWSNSSMTDGTFILGIANKVQSNTGAVCYYIVDYAHLNALMQYMLPETSDLWTNGFTGLTDSLYRSIYSPFDYIKSCKWFPFVINSHPVTDYILFGNYKSNVLASPINPGFSSWERYNHVFSMPTGWNSRAAKYRTNPYARMYFKLNPWGVIELNPMDFKYSQNVNVYIDVDFVSGDALLRIYSGSSNPQFVSQHVAKIGVDIQLTASSMDLLSLAKGGVSAIGTIAATIAGGIPLAGLLTSGANAASNIIQSATPTLQNNLGQPAASASFMEGDADLIVMEPIFADERNSEFGKPLMKTKLISDIPGYIKCADGDNDAIGSMYIEEREEVAQYLTNGFYYE